MGEENMSYRTVRIPEALALEIDQIAETFGYRTRAEFVNDAIRRLLDRKKDELKCKEKVIA